MSLSCSGEFTGANLTPQGMLFDGSTAKLIINPTDAANRSYTVECFFKRGVQPYQEQARLFAWDAYTSGQDLCFTWDGSNKIIDVNGNRPIQSGSPNIVDGKWYHLAICYDSATTKLHAFITDIATYSTGQRFGLEATGNYTVAHSRITLGLNLGGESTSTYSSTPFKGLITNFRVVVGQALYTAPGFPIPTSPLTAISGTTLLVQPTRDQNGNNIMADVGPNNYTPISRLGTTFSTDSPFPIPGAPTAVSAVAGHQKALVSFSPPTNVGSSSIQYYTVTSSPGGIDVSGTASPILVPGLTNGTPYTFTVKATNLTGAGDISSPSAAVTPIAVPDAPTDVTAVAGVGQAIVSFTPPVANGTPAITTYRVTSSPGNITTTGESSEITIAGLTNDITYTFTVAALNENGTGLSSTASNAVTPSATPSAPRNVTVSAGVGAATVAWLVPVSVGAGIASYTITATAAGQSTRTQTVNAPDTSGTISGLTNDVTYQITVSATTTDNTTGPASTGVATTPSATPSAPQNVTASPASGSVNVSWQPPLNVAAGIASYTITAVAAGYPTRTQTVNAPTTSGTVSGLTNGIAYQVTVSATTTDNTTGPTAIATTGTPETIVLNYSIGAAGTGGSNDSNGGVGGATTVSFKTTYVIASGGGAGGQYNNNLTAAGGTASGGDVNVTGGTGRGSSGDSGGGGGGAIGGANATHDGGSNGDKGADAADVSGLFAAVTALGYPTANIVTANGSISNSSGLNNKGYDASGFGCGGGGGGFWGGDGGKGLFGGGGGGASGNGPIRQGGIGGAGAIVLAISTISSTTYSLLTSGTSYSIPANATAFSLWAIGAGGGGGGSTTSDGVSAGGGGAGGVSKVTYRIPVTVTPAAEPEPPTNVAAVAGNGQATVTFTPPANNGGSPVLYYVVTSNPPTADVSGAASPITVAGLTNNTSYTFTVKAVNALGTSTSSSASAAATPLSPPGAPTIIGASLTGTTLAAEWSASTGSPASYTLAATVTREFPLSNIASSPNLAVALDGDSLGTIGTSISSWTNSVAGSAVGNFINNASGVTSGTTPVVAAGSVAGTKVARFNDGRSTDSLVQTTAFASNVTTYTMMIVARWILTGGGRVIQNTTSNLLWGWYDTTANTYYSDQAGMNRPISGTSATSSTNLTAWRIYTITMTGTTFKMSVGGVNYTINQGSNTPIRRISLGGVAGQYNEPSKCEVAALYIWNGRVISEKERLSYESQLATKYGVPSITWNSYASDTDTSVNVTKTVAGDVTSTTMTLPQTLTSVPVSLYATNAGGNSATVTETVTTSGFGTYTVTTSEPINLTATPGNQQVTLAWSLPSFTGGTSITGYYIYDGSDNLITTNVSVNVASRTATLTGLTNGLTYRYKVAAVNIAGAGTKTGVVSAIPFSYTAPQTTDVAAVVSASTNTSAALSTLSTIYTNVESAKKPEFIAATTSTFVNRTVTNSSSATTQARISNVAAQILDMKNGLPSGEISTVLASSVAAVTASSLTAAEKISSLVVAMNTVAQTSISQKSTLSSAIQTDANLAGAKIPLTAEQTTALLASLPSGSVNSANAPTTLSVIVPSSNTVNLPTVGSAYTVMTPGIPYTFNFGGITRTVTYNATANNLNVDGTTYTVGQSFYVGTGTFQIFATGSVGVNVSGIPCFPAGVKIRTPTGSVPVETLKTGDKVVTAAGRIVPIRMHSYSLEATTEATAPYFVPAHALGPSAPAKPLHLSPLHAFQVRPNVWWCAQQAAKVSPKIQQYDLGKPITYYHVECPNFFRDNLVADGVTVESFAGKQLTTTESRNLYKFNKAVGGYVRVNPTAAATASR
jgi:hypothetical protein